MKKAIVIAVAFAALVAILAVVNRPTDFSETELQDMVGRTRTLLRLADSENVDWDAFSREYDSGPRAVVRWVDTHYDVEMDDKIMTSIEAGRTGAFPTLNAQIASLTVIRVFREYLTAQAGASASDREMRGRWAVEALAPVVAQGADWAGVAADVNIPLDAALKSDAPWDFRQLEEAVRIGVVASWLFELDGIERERSERMPKALIHTVRALQFMHMMYQEYAPGHREDAVFIYGELEKEPSKIDLAEIRRRMKGIFQTSMPIPESRYGGPMVSALE